MELEQQVSVLSMTCQELSDRLTSELLAKNTVKTQLEMYIGENKALKAQIEELTAQLDELTGGTHNENRA